MTPRPVDAPFLFDVFQKRDSEGRLAEELKVADLERKQNKERYDARAGDPQALMLNAARVVRARLGGLADDALQEFAEFVLGHGIVNLMVADDRTQAAILYRSHNVAGLRELSSADLMKLEAIEHDSLAPSIKQKAAQAWDETEDFLGRARFTELLEILPLLITREHTKRTSDLERWRTRVFDNRNAEDVVLNQLPLYAKLMDELLSGEIVAVCRTEEDRRALEETNSLLRGMIFSRDRNWIAPAIGMLYANRDNPKFLLRYFRGLDRLCFACFFDAITSDKRPQRFASVVAAGEDETLLEAAFTLSAEEQQKVARRIREPFGRYNWHQRALAVRANMACPNGRGFGPQEDVSVEHILPARPCRVWEEAGWDEAAAERCRNLLGNFVLLTRGQNNKAAQRTFAEKRDVYFNTAEAPVHALTHDVREATIWTEAVVRARTERLARLLLASWKIEP